MNSRFAVTESSVPTITSHQTDTRIAYLTNILAPYWKPTFECLACRYRLRIFLSTPMERNRPWQVDWGNLDVVLQRTITLRGRWKHPSGFAERIYIHLPVDTLCQLHRFRPNIVISNEMGFRTLLNCVYRQLVRGSRLLVVAEIAESTEHGRGHCRSALRRFIRSYVDGFLVLGQSGGRYIYSLGVPHSKIFQIGYTTDVQRFCAVSLPRGTAIAHRLLYVGQLIERKGLLSFVKTISQWASEHPQRQLEFVIVGDGPSRVALANTAVASNLRITFHGNVAFSDLPDVYSKCGIFVFPTLADTWGVVVNEAMAAGLPVLGSIYSQAVEEMIEDGVNGWSFRPDSGNETYSAIDRALNASVETLNGMRQCAREKAMRYTPEIVAANIGKAVDLVLGTA